MCVKHDSYGVILSRKVRRPRANQIREEKGDSDRQPNSRERVSTAVTIAFVGTAISWHPPSPGGAGSEGAMKSQSWDNRRVVSKGLEKERRCGSNGLGPKTRTEELTKKWCKHAENGVFVCARGRDKDVREEWINVSFNSAWREVWIGRFFLFSDDPSTRNKRWGTEYQGLQLVPFVVIDSGHKKEPHGRAKQKKQAWEEVKYAL